MPAIILDNYKEPIALVSQCLKELISEKTHLEENYHGSVFTKGKTIEKAFYLLGILCVATKEIIETDQIEVFNIFIKSIITIFIF